MATTSTTSSASTSIIQTLGAGSGIDVKTLAKSLAEAEVAPQKDRVSANISKTEARISGYGALSYTLSQLKASFEKLNDASDFGAPRVVNNQPAAFGLTAASTAQTGSHSIEVLQLAKPQRNVSGGFAGTSTSLNAGQPFSLSLSVNGGAAQSINVATDTPEGMVSAINQAGLGLTAQLIKTDSSATPYAVVVTGQEGLAKGFSLTTAQAGVSFSRQLNAASDALLKVNGLDLTRATNNVTDVIPNVTLNLYAPTSSAARVDLSRDTQTAKDNIKSLVQAYNDFDQSLKILEDRKSQVEGVGGSLAGDSLVRTVRNQMRSLLVANSSTPGASLTAMRDLGLSFDRTGRMTLDDAKLDKALESNFDDVAKLFSAGTNNKSLFSVQPAGLAGDAVVKIDKMLRSTGQLAQQTESANKDLTKYKARLKDLDGRLDKLLERYTNQFSLMESVVGNSKNLRSSLTSTFDSLNASNK